MLSQTHRAARPCPRTGLLAAALSLLAFGSSWAAEPAQVPLTSRVAEAPTPNVMVTVDDSGSMLADFMPEGPFKINGYNVNLGTAWVGSVPADWRKLCTSGQVACVNGKWPSGQNYLAGVVTGLKGGETIYQMQYRSPDVNRIYYNPDLRYQPWLKPDGSGRMDASNPAAARYDPVISNGTFNLSINYTLPVAPAKPASKINTRWYTAAGTVVAEAKDFYPGLVYRLKDKGSPSVAANFTRYDVNATDGKHAADTKHPNRVDCAGSKCTQQEELQNFANWFTYYRMRESLTKAAVSDSLSAFKDKLRIGWGRINKNNSERIDGVNFKVIENEAKGGPIRKFDVGRMTTVLTGLQGLTSWPSTPLRTALDEVGRYFDVPARGATGSPWLEDPRNTSSEKLACRRSVSLLMTDGYYNDNSYTGTGNVDGSDGPDYNTLELNPNSYTPTQYKAATPYLDGTPLSKTLADVAMKYFVRDLETTIQNKVWPKYDSKPGKSDIAFWQHLTQYTVGLGVYGTLPSSTPAEKEDTLNKLASGALKWPDPNSGNQQKIDDMWHAAVNTGGDFYSAANVTELTEALVSALSGAAGNEAKEAGVATSSATIIDGNVKYVPKYRSVSWYGDLEAYDLNDDGLQGALLWSASAKLLPRQHAERNLFTWEPGDGGQPKPFTWDGMGSANQGRVGSPELTNYIRGDDSNEGGGKTFRARYGKVLGDFVNSPPVVVGGKLDLGYSVFDPSYTDFVARKRARNGAAIVVGGNAGAVHMFRSVDGAEVFGYLPREGLVNLHTIAEKDYGLSGNFHVFFVDGPMNETDAKIPTRRHSGEEWANLVIGAMGAGGKAFFAMHVPTEFGSDGLTANDLDAKTLLWEKSGTTDADIGYMFADFAVGKLKGGGWKAFVGNGVYSTNGNAVLLVVDMATGTIEKRLTVANTGDTGLMGVSLIKDTQTQEVVGAYAGDLKGNVWRFDFEGGGEASWKIGFNGKPLFSATDYLGESQPITVPPVFVDHPKEGRVVLFGTGKLIDESDSGSDQRQTYYGVWDHVKIGESSAALDSLFEGVGVDRTKLVVQEIDKDNPKEALGVTYYEVKSTPVNWDTHWGWLVELPWERQRVIYPSMILAANYVYFSTIVPAAPAEACDSTTGVGYNFLLVAASGEQSPVPIIDTNGDGEVDGDDMLVGGYATRSDGRDAIVVGDDGKTHLCSTTAQCALFEPPATEIVIKDRVWKQILTPPTP